MHNFQYIIATYFWPQYIFHIFSTYSRLIATYFQHLFDYRDPLDRWILPRSFTPRNCPQSEHIQEILLS
jgi:hypothetical protein